MRPTLIALGVTLIASVSHAQAHSFTLAGAAGDWFGGAYASVGDYDGDGRPDFAIGAEHADGLQPDSGVVRIVSTGTGTVVREFQGVHTGDRFGAAVAAISDITGDGVIELVVGAPGFDYTSTVLDGGRAYLLNGATGAAIYTSTYSVAGSQLGAAVAAIGDVTGDGFIDYSVGVPYADISAPDAGSVYLHNGFSGFWFHVIQGENAGDHFGASIASAGKFTFVDSVPDLAVGAPDFDTGSGQFSRGKVYVYSGVAPYSLYWSFTGSENFGKFGATLAGGGDVNGDGWDDLVVGEPFSDVNGSNSGRVRVFTGGIVTTLYDLPGGAAQDTFGSALAILGDTDGDGKDEFAIGSPLAEYLSYTDAGRVDVLRGSNGTVLGSVNGFANSGGLGQLVGAPGLVNADSFADLVVGAPYDTTAPATGGHVQLYLLGVPNTTSFCTAKVNSLGCTPYIFSGGAPTHSIVDNFHIYAAQVVPQKSGLMIWSLSTNNVPLGGGTLCVHAPLARTTVQVSQYYNVGLCDAFYDYHMTQSYMAAHGLTPGVTFYAQYWSRDNGFAPPNNIGLTNGLQVVVFP